MNITIVGAGISGLSAAFELQKSGFEVKIHNIENNSGYLNIKYSDKNELQSIVKKLTAQ